MYINYCYKHADLAYATSACLNLGTSNDNIENFIQTNSILNTISIGSTHVGPITATSAYADVVYLHYILLTVAYIMLRQQSKICV